MASKITIDRGVSYDFTYNHTDSAGAAEPLTNKTVYFTVKETEFDSDATDAAAAIKKTITSSEHDDAAGGITSWTLSDTDTYKDPGKYFFDVIVEDETTGLAEPPSLKGNFVIDGHATNRNVGNE